MAETNNQQQDAGLSGETERLLRSYFDAFANLYGIVPLYRALRIVQKQNPELALTEEAFLAFVGQIGQEEHHYIIAGAEDIYSDIEEPTPSLKREIIAEYLYAVDDFESYVELKAEQEGKPFYIPEKEELLRYQDDCYVEETKEAGHVFQRIRDEYLPCAATGRCGYGSVAAGRFRPRHPGFPVGRHAKQPGAGRTTETGAQCPLSVRKRKEV